MDLLLNELPDTFVSLQIHTSGYTSVWGNARKTFYNITGVPTAEFDGDRECRGAYTNVQQMYTWYKNTYLLCMAETTDTWVEIEAFKVAANRVKVIAEVGVDAGGTAKDVRVHAVQLLDHFPSSPTWYRNCVKQGQDLGVISLTPGNSVEVTHEFTLDANSMAQPNDVKIVVFAQDPLPAKPAQIRNAWCVNGPIDFRVGDLNCDGNVDFGDINPFVLALTDPNGYGQTFPDCNIMNGDCNGDNLVDFGDINPFVAILTAP